MLSLVCLYGLLSTWNVDKVTTPTISRLIKYFLKFNGKEMHYFFYTFSCYPFINPIVNPADILPVNGIPKLVIASEAVAAWSLV